MESLRNDLLQEGAPNYHKNSTDHLREETSQIILSNYLAGPRIDLPVPRSEVAKQTAIQQQPHGPHQLANSSNSRQPQQQHASNSQQSSSNNQTQQQQPTTRNT
eukprot:5287722-Amphidinium_carterae.1